MKRTGTARVDELRAQSVDQAEFMRQLAQIDENAPMSTEFMARIVGGTTDPNNPLKNVSTYGMRPPSQDSTGKF